MSFKQHWQWILSLAVSTAVVAGCGQAPMSTQPSQADRDLLNSEDQKAKKRHGMLSFLDKLELTEVQKAQIDAVKAEVKADLDMEKVKALHLQMKEVMLADTVDKAALTALLNQGFDIKQAHLTRMVDALAKIREILTAEQRQTVAVTILDRMSEKHADKDKEKSKGHKGMKHAKRAMKAAIASFMLTGNKEALNTAFTMMDREAKIQKMADKLAAMSKEDRQKLVEKVQKKIDKKTGDDKAESPTETPTATPAETPTATPAT